MNLGLAALTVSAGQHIGHFYRSREEARRLWLSFLREGLRNEDKCICHLPEDLSAEEVFATLYSFQIDAGKAFESGQLILKQNNFDSEELQQEVVDLSHHFEGSRILRWVGDVTYSSSKADSDMSFLKIENLPVVCLCQYDLTKLSGSLLMDAQERHPVWIINDVVHSNPLYQQMDVNPGWFDERYRILVEINEVASSLNRDTFFSGIADVIGKAISFDCAELALFDVNKNTLRIVNLMETSGSHGIAGEIEVPAADSILLHVMLTKEPLLCENLHEVATGEIIHSTAHTRSAIVVPLRRNGSVLGTLTLGSKEPYQYSAKDAELLMEVARQIVLPVENILAHEEIARLRARLDYEYLYLKEEIHVQRQFKNIVGQSLGIRRVLKAVETVAPTDAGVLLYGETGTGKELVVHSIHELSSRKEKPLVKINCAALPAGLMESELFGHEKGSFTGAFSKKLGRFEIADGGTIFLDEIGDLQLDLQAKLLRVLQEGEFERVGGNQTIHADVRVIAATNRDLEKSIHEGKFRADLYYRLNVFPIRIPPLRERKEDIPLIVKYFVMKYGAKFRKNIERIPQATIDALLAYFWPGNIRELENLIERAVIMCQSTQLEPGRWLPPPGGTPVESRIPTLEELEREHILEVLQMTSWRVSGERGAAKLLGMKPTTLEARMKKLGIFRQL